MHIQKALEKSGFSHKEARVYLACLALGSSTISDIANEAKIPRTSCYTILESLQEKELINIFKNKLRKYYEAENPEKLLLNMAESRALIKEILPRLKAWQYKRKTKIPKPTTYLYECADGVKKLLNDILAQQKPILAITSIDDALDVLGDNFRDFIQMRYKKNLPVKLLTHRTKESLLLKRGDSDELRNTRFLPDIYNFKTANFIYGDSVALISFNKTCPMGLVIQDPNISETMKMYFEIIWNNSDLR